MRQTKILINDDRVATTRIRSVAVAFHHVHVLFLMTAGVNSDDFIG